MARNVKSGQKSRWRDRARMLDTAKRATQLLSGMDAEELVRHVVDTAGTPDRTSDERGTTGSKSPPGRESRKSKPALPLGTPSSRRTAVLTHAKPNRAARDRTSQKKRHAGLPDSVVGKWQDAECSDLKGRLKGTRPGELPFLTRGDLQNLRHAVARGYYTIEQCETELTPRIILQILKGGTKREQLAAAKVLVQMRKLAVDQLTAIDGNRMNIHIDERRSIRIEYSKESQDEKRADVISVS